jgi:hypothetical protein
MRALLFDAYERDESCPYDLAHDLGKTLCILGQRKQKGQDMPVVRLIGEVLLSAAERRVSGPKVGSRVMCDGLGGSSGSGKVEHVHADGSLRVRFQDGSWDDVLPEQVQVAPVASADEHTANWAYATRLSQELQSMAMDADDPKDELFVVVAPRGSPIYTFERQLPPGWHQHEEGHRTFYVNQATGQRTQDLRVVEKSSFAAVALTVTNACDGEDRHPYHYVDGDEKEQKSEHPKTVFLDPHADERKKDRASLAAPRASTRPSGLPAHVKSAPRRRRLTNWRLVMFRFKNLTRS